MDLHDFFSFSIVENLQRMELIPKKDLTFLIILLSLCYGKKRGDWFHKEHLVEP